MFDASEFAELLPEVVTLEPLVSQEGNGVPAFGPAVSIRARVEAAVIKLTNAPGEEHRARAVVYLAPQTIEGTFYTLSARDRLTLPAGYSPRNPRLIAVVRQNDREGIHHIEAHVLMRDSTLQRRIILQRPMKTQDPATGETRIAWSDVFNDDATVRPVSGEESFAEYQRQAWAVATFTVAYDLVADEIPTAEYRIVCGGRTYDVLDVRVLGQAESVELLAKGRAE